VTCVTADELERVEGGTIDPLTLFVLVIKGVRLIV
jgi:hypothetical protein